MKSLDEYVEASLNYRSAEVEFIEELCDLLKLDLTHIKNVEIKTVEQETKILQKISIRMIGENKISSDDISKIKGMSIITPNVIEIDVGEIHL